MALFGKKSKSSFVAVVSYSVLIYVIFVAAQLFAPCRALLENTAYQKIPPAKYLAAMLKNEILTAFIFGICRPCFYLQQSLF